MKKILVFCAAILAVFTFSSCSTYNSMVTQDEAVAQAWANVEAQYQRRADLIPNLVQTVKGVAAHEQQTLTAVMEARAKATQVKLSAEELTEEKMAQYQKAQSGLSGALGRLMMISENYPQLKANENFSQLQAQLEGTENRITVARENFNTVTRQYNSTVRKFPNNLIAGQFGFETKPYFTANEGAATAPSVEF